MKRIVVTATYIAEVEEDFDLQFVEKSVRYNMGNYMHMFSAQVNKHEYPFFYLAGATTVSTEDTPNTPQTKQPSK